MCVCVCPLHDTIAAPAPGVFLTTRVQFGLAQLEVC